MAEHDEHSSFIKTPKQLITIVLLAFVVPIAGIIMMVQLVVNRPSADPATLEPAAVAARIAPVGQVEIGAPAAAPGARGGEEIVKAVCSACHTPGVSGAPKIGDKAAWGALIKEGLPKMLAVAIKGTPKGMPARGGAADLTDEELARAIVFMANQSGGSLKEPAAKPAAAKK